MTKLTKAEKIEKLPIASDEFLKQNTNPMPCSDFQIETVQTFNYLSKKINEIIDHLYEK